MKHIVLVLLLALATVSTFASVTAHDDRNDRDGDGYSRDADNDDGYNRDRDDDDRNREGDAVSYINPDTGAATENSDVNTDSSCYSPDQDDTQRLSDAGTANRNVHNDACFLDDDGNRVDGPASFQSFGSGLISACPDPDGAGPKVAVLSDTNGDGRADLCFQSGFQEGKGAGDGEFHARMNNTTQAGTQTVVWCADYDQNGCDDERNDSTIEIDWVR